MGGGEEEAVERWGRARGTACGICRLPMTFRRFGDLCRFCLERRGCRRGTRGGMIYEAFASSLYCRPGTIAKPGRQRKISGS